MGGVDLLRVASEHAESARVTNEEDSVLSVSFSVKALEALISWAREYGSAAEKKVDDAWRMASASVKHQAEVARREEREAIAKGIEKVAGENWAPVPLRFAADIARAGGKDPRTPPDPSIEDDHELVEMVARHLKELGHHSAAESVRERFGA